MAAASSSDIYADPKFGAEQDDASTGYEPPLVLHDGNYMEPCINGQSRYIIFLEPSDLTRTPHIGCGGCCGMQACCSALGLGYDFNRLRWLRTNVFPKLDGSVELLQLSSADENNTYLALTNADKTGDKKLADKARDSARNAMAGVLGSAAVADGIPTEPYRKRALVPGIARRNVLYRLLPKEGLYVPAADWAVEYERSEIMEMARALQLVGGLVIDYEHVAAADQSLAKVVPTANSAVGSVCLPLTRLLAAKATTKAAAAAAPASLSSIGRGSPSPLSGRLLFRLNGKPSLTGLDELKALMGPYFYHLRRNPALLDRLAIRLARGILVGDAFTLSHTTPDSQTLEGYRLLEQGSIPAGRGFRMSGEDVIHSGYKRVPRPRMETRFRVLYPDMEEARVGVTGAPDLQQEAEAIWAKGPLHPLASLRTWESLTPNGPAIVDAKKADSVLEQAKKEAGKGLVAWLARKGKKAGEGGGDDAFDAAVKAAVAGVAATDRAAMVAVKRALYEASTEAYLKSSMLDYVCALKGLPAPGASARYTAANPELMYGGTVALAKQGFFARLFNLKWLKKGGKRAKASGAAPSFTLPAGSGGVAVAWGSPDAVEIEEAALPPPIPSSRPPMSHPEPAAGTGAAPLPGAPATATA